MNIVIMVLIATNAITLCLCCHLVDVLNKMDAQLEKDMDWIDPDAKREADK